MRPGPPLWPAGHLPLKGGDRMSRRLSPIAEVARRGETPELPISPLEGEMAGRAERGA
ncbi:lytic murein transglycosylase [Mesorhizobium sp. B2-7-1]|nr:lytic murein transglycosylase [Mesorhizobium sp. B2-7-1]